MVATKRAFAGRVFLVGVAAAVGLLVGAPAASADDPDQQCNSEQQAQGNEQQQQQCQQQQSGPGLPNLPGNSGNRNQPNNPNGADVTSPNCMIIDGVPTMVANGQVFEGYHDFGPPCPVVFGGH